MSAEDVLFDGVGSHATVNHVAVQTAFGMMIPATTLFQKLGYTVDPDHKAEGPWGKAIFLTKNLSIDIQLTDSTDPSPVSSGESHVAIMVDDPETVSLHIRDWARNQGVWGVQIDKVPGGKIFVSIPAILTLSIELVPNPKACPTCRGKGTVLKGREGVSHDEKCQACRGYGYELDV